MHNNTLAFSTMQTRHRCGAITKVSSVEDLRGALDLAHDPIIVGGGSNILFVKDSHRDLIVMSILGRNILDSRDATVDIQVSAGETWDDIVAWCVDNDWGGIENLSLIPGLCGAAPMQNIGAYGVELKDVLLWVEVLDRSSDSLLKIDASDCDLGYRHSIFKGAWRDQYVITSIAFRLTKRGFHNLNTSYGAINDLLPQNGIANPDIGDIRDAVISIRQSKLPDPSHLPNCGSFFKNPILSKEQFAVLQTQFSDTPHYVVDIDNVKIPAAWLIDQCGWKGRRIGKVGVHDQQALVLVNYGSQNGMDILRLAEQIKTSVKNKYAIQLQEEVNIYP